MSRCGLALLFVCLAMIPGQARAQGSLTPSGPPAPVMKTLAQVEPRTLIGGLPFTITNSGSYYLAGSLTAGAGEDGIVVQADNVTLDLNGFTLSGGTGSLTGIIVSNRQNLTVRNGTLRDWGGAGLAAGAAAWVRVERVLATGNGGVGVAVGSNSLVSDCLIVGNLGDGILVASSCLVQNNTCNNNGTTAAHAGIHALGTGNRIEGNHLAANAGRGVRVDGLANLIIRNDAANNGATDLDLAAGNSYGTNSAKSLRNGKPVAAFSPEVDQNTIDYSLLYWCIDEINRGRIYRGMTKQMLLDVMGKSLRFSKDGKSARSTLSRTTNPTYQAPPPWEIKFQLDDEGLVEDYCIDLHALGK